MDSTSPSRTLIPPAPTEPVVEGSGAVPDPIQQLLDRPREHRAREYKFRFAQTVVFGLPVVGLWTWGPALDPVHHARWATVLQALLTGWILYVNAGMLIEGLLLRRMTSDFLVATAAAMMFCAGIVMAVAGRGGTSLFLACVELLGVWTGARWGVMRRHLSS